MDITLTTVEVKAHPHKLKGVWKCKRYGEGAVTIVSKYRCVFWFYNIWYKLFPPKFHAYIGADVEQELIDTLVEHIKKDSAE